MCQRGSVALWILRSAYPLLSCAPASAHSDAPRPLVESLLNLGRQAIQGGGGAPPGRPLARGGHGRPGCLPSLPPCTECVVSWRLVARRRHLRGWSTMAAALDNRTGVRPASAAYGAPSPVRPLHAARAPFSGEQASRMVTGRNSGSTALWCVLRSSLRSSR